LCSFSSFVESQGQALLDLSLYVSSENYNAVTRPIFSTLQNFPLTWITPQKLRAAAKARTQHLGLSSLDIDTDIEPEKEKSVLPESLRRSQASVTSMLSSHPESAAQIRLDSLATSFFEPLQELRDQSRFFISSQPTSLDCLALGYLSLALLPDLPSPWLSSCMRKKFPQLCAFVHDAQRMFFGGPVTLTDACLTPESEEERERRVRGKGGLPWVKDSNEGLLAIGGVLAAHIVDSLPVISDLIKARKVQKIIEKAVEEDPEADEQLAEMHDRVVARRRDIYVTVGTVAVGVGLFVGFMFQNGIWAVLNGDMRITMNEGEYETGEDVELDGGWDHVDAGVAALAQQMDFLQDLQFGNLQQEDVEPGNIVPDRTI
jgi:sorting and assembly machinery component 37